MCVKHHLRGVDTLVLAYGGTYRTGLYTFPPDMYQNCNLQCAIVTCHIIYDPCSHTTGCRTLVYSSIIYLTRLVARNSFIAFSCHECSKLYITLLTSCSNPKHHRVMCNPLEKSICSILLFYEYMMLLQSVACVNIFHGSYSQRTIIEVNANVPLPRRHMASCR